MAFEPFDAAWQRWERARARMTEAVQVWNGFIEPHDAFDFSLDGDDTGVFILRVHQVRPTPPEMAVVIGEWLYNLRAALDYLMWATACYVAGSVPPPKENVLQYPIYDTESAWTSNLYRLDGLLDHHREMLLLMQPFNSDIDANYLGWLNRLARIDRHRNLVTGSARLGLVEPVLRCPEGSRVIVEWGERMIVDGRADVARFTVQPYWPGAVVDVNPRVGIDPEIDEWSRSPFWGKVTFQERLRMIQVFVAGEIAAYEYDCTGSSRKSNMVSDEFQKAMDERRGPVPKLARQRPPMTWTRGSGKVSTRTMFEGADFCDDGAGPIDSGPSGLGVAR
ncbi:hypothetical protein [Demequina muriae]|uniref:Uncharacterized protein n=1 Tax=Demequina muriae TaxID=3051664 RepID=A0ABT8GJM9_9MICO|nr:hypothetical protein [Demequina sp. EGI L300058]MDN4481625.1 hypothetical protein [Demequina sp. EGI L300058]